MILPGRVETDWLNMNLGKPDMKIIDLRAQSKYNSGHIPGSLRLNPESLRGSVRGVPSCLLPAEILAEHFSLMGIQPDDFIVLITTNRIRDATLAGMAFERLKHNRYAVLRGGFSKWQAEKRAVDTILPSIKSSHYPVPDRPDTFTVTAKEVLAAVSSPETTILDTRPVSYFSGEKTR
jgi:3-mercaptopyruvate sulfurtransferase SseA